MNDGCWGEVTGVLRLFRRQMEWLDGVGNHGCSKVGLVRSFLKWLEPLSACCGENMFSTGDSAADPGSTAVERGERGDGSGKAGEVGVGGIMLYHGLEGPMLESLLLKQAGCWDRDGSKIAQLGCMQVDGEILTEGKKENSEGQGILNVLKGPGVV